ncbi:TetR/AcrR family transcriptional regulator [Neotamlana laminarinivorans]|uniref:TetR/AcrR family transcriptional regulator n=1 Tax=Neotamlana laminarinivorans TaxID=2883124 RepID=A0A9X1L602_9FLAO|nr:TetR/AcrR family transcriptional regulator [Tamlana laminarinivorans]MCB4799976.1 TetR/AcrR family transcriptional regulator [Tamlana laminarinivorans]
MRPKKVVDKDMLIGLSKVFRDKGYEGASLKELAEITGLKKASLYHRFPKGKQQMAEAVFTHIDEWVRANIFSVLNDKSKTPQIRLKNGLMNIKKLYAGGKESCIFNAFSKETGMSLFEESIKNSMVEWVKAFTEIGLELMLPIKKSKAYAIQTLIEIQGSLIVTKGLNDINLFETTLNHIEKRYLNKQF